MRRSKNRPFARKNVGFSAIAGETLLFGVPMIGIFTTALRAAHPWKPQIEEMPQTFIFAVELGAVERHTFLEGYTSYKNEDSIIRLPSPRITRILIVEDNAGLLAMNQINLEKAGFDVETATNGEEAIAIMDAKKIDLLLLDLLTPKVNGFGVMDHVRKMQYAFPIIVLTNLNENIDKKHCKELGATDFLVKSDTDLPDLAEKVRAYL